MCGKIGPLKTIYYPISSLEMSVLISVPRAVFSTSARDPHPILDFHYFLLIFYLLERLSATSKNWKRLQWKKLTKTGMGSLFLWLITEQILVVTQKGVMVVCVPFDNALDCVIKGPPDWNLFSWPSITLERVGDCSSESVYCIGLSNTTQES